ncbi:hypothetical protein GCK32_022433 [Trichostrongylus colubriformis]|uniref:Exonuclease domain-containing protein n=1 Tax=Trichostrongylus colubriformis TaxID=6319 RepID=A0AAN8IN17_TRICO
MKVINFAYLQYVEDSIQCWKFTFLAYRAIFRRSSAEGRCFKQSLKSLAREQLDMDIQSVGGHDSAEDAWAAMRLVLRAARSPHL